MWSGMGLHDASRGNWPKFDPMDNCLYSGVNLYKKVGGRAFFPLDQAYPAKKWGLRASGLIEVYAYVLVYAASVCVVHICV